MIANGLFLTVQVTHCVVIFWSIVVTDSKFDMMLLLKRANLLIIKNRMASCL